MPISTRLSRDFFNRSTLQVARDLLGARLVRVENGKRISGIIVETEAYRGEEDQGCHARAGRTARTEVMYGQPGHAYVYFTYGMHWMLNFVAEVRGFPAAVLIRAVIPTEGLATIEERRGGQPPSHWTDGPAKICQAFGIDKELHGADLCASDSELFVEKGVSLTDSGVTTGPRVGLNSVPEPWKSIPWRFCADVTAEVLDTAIQRCDG
ncbi:MAG TPA: DNA-3-methyladenine glycosylase [Anaerolineales bacterium]|nr:DNA-3-methyladenine glycosylase [Anaerolineales bacterium]